MTILAGVVGILIIVAIILDAFETIILPRRVTRRVRLARLFYRLTWIPWSMVARRVRNPNRRETFLSYYGPLSLLLLLVFWAVGEIVGFGLLNWALGSPIATSLGRTDLGTNLYVSAALFLPLAGGGATLDTELARYLGIAEVATGIGFLTLIIGYVPGFSGAFSEREIDVSLLDARAGSPPTAVELLRRSSGNDLAGAVVSFLEEWEHWSAELMENQLSSPVLGFFRSEHENQSWVAALTMVLDLSALVLVGIDGAPPAPARLAFAMARHAAVDLSQVFNTPPRPPEPDRLPPAELARLRALLAETGVNLRAGAEADRKLAELRALYEPYVNGIATRLLYPLPPWIPPTERPDDWQTTAWE